MGYGIQFYYLPYVVSLIWIKNKYCKFFVYIFTPIILLVFGFESNPIFDYLLAMWSFIGFLFLEKWKNNIFFIVFVSAISFILIFIFNTISGILFYKVTIQFSIAFNGFFNLINFLCFTLFLIIFCKSFYLKNTNLLNVKDIKLK